MKFTMFTHDASLAHSESSESDSGSSPPRSLAPYMSAGGKRIPILQPDIGQLFQVLHPLETFVQDAYLSGRVFA